LSGCPVHVGDREVGEAEALGGVVQADVELDIFASAGGGDGEGEGVAGEGGAVRGDVGEAVREEGACQEESAVVVVMGGGVTCTFVVAGVCVQVESRRREVAWSSSESVQLRYECLSSPSYAILPEVLVNVRCGGGWWSGCSSSCSHQISDQGTKSRSLSMKQMLKAMFVARVAVVV